MRRHTLSLIGSYTDDDAIIFEFTLPKGLRWEAGQHGLFTLPRKKVHGQRWRAFSIASVPEEGCVRIATKIPETPSSFKQVLRSFVPGDTITLYGPYGWLRLQDTTTPVICVAGGIGITPFRALFKSFEQTNTRIVELVYACPQTYYFKEFLDEVAQKDPHIRITYTRTVEETNAAITQAVHAHGTESYYLISGAPGMIKGVGALLRAQRVPRQRILSDSFRGY